MAGFIVFIIVFVFIFGMAVSIISGNKGKRRPRLYADELPEGLGIEKDAAKPLAQHLEKALSDGFQSNIKNRMLKEHPSWSEKHFDWVFFELKRFFVLSSILKSVPMFSGKVDAVWHEMLMFTRDYEDFSKKFYNSFLHHTPNMEIVPIPGERAFFDWVYLQVFSPARNSRLIWGEFLRTPIEQGILHDFRTKSEGELLAKYFRDGEAAREIQLYLIRQLKNDIREAEMTFSKNEKKPFTRISSSHDMSMLLPAAVFFSIYEHDDYSSHIEEVLPVEMMKSGYAGATSCSGFACSTDHDSDSGSCSGGANCSGGSSCSSCGGGGGCGGS
ncbi:hypothetical protein B14911_28015 [Bacillus sp. NRRL B-14911]|uniref:Uncharacterized protein n=1 Tax=Bacillus infantis NRRL B-14911 TaxID=1367477 RepID=U5L955_9BACI|nr:MULTISPECIES: hypothetical protein [Bacillus]AGX04369.1 hypothetical protein N288_12315 [Bacillus infantis NRRL B-14911]EAR66928.1 hypothetical protein B14911_28015 [Bacillus sp. NRRL B-14911]